MTDEEPFPGSPDDHMQRLERLTAQLEAAKAALLAASHVLEWAESEGFLPESADLALDLVRTALEGKDAP